MKVMINRSDRIGCLSYLCVGCFGGGGILCARNRGGGAYHEDEDAYLVPSDWEDDGDDEDWEAGGTSARRARDLQKNLTAVCALHVLGVAPKKRYMARSDFVKYQVVCRVAMDAVLLDGVEGLVAACVAVGVGDVSRLGALSSPSTRTPAV